MDQWNVQKLIDHLETNVTDEQFDMTRYRSHCGTIGCIAGHAAFLAGNTSRHHHPRALQSIHNTAARFLDIRGDVDAFGQYMHASRYVFQGYWTTKLLNAITRRDAIAYLKKCLEKGSFDVRIER